MLGPGWGWVEGWCLGWTRGAYHLEIGLTLERLRAAEPCVCELILAILFINLSVAI